jgi:hypothetical protein
MYKYIQVTGTHFNIKLPLKGKGIKQLRTLKSALKSIKGEKNHLISIITSEHPFTY